jgi:hypothetical protein
MKGQAGTGRRNNNAHDKKYWDRLKRQFRTCEYDHTGAYGEGRHPKSRAMKALHTRMEDYEQMISKLKEIVNE